MGVSSHYRLRSGPQGDTTRTTAARLQFPPTDDICSRIALGTGRLYAGDLANMEATVRRAYDLGIRHIDTSVHYDNGAPHAAIARLLRDIPRNEIFVSTKIGHIQSEFPEYRSLYRNRDFLFGIVHECYRMLGGTIDLLQVHEADLRFWWEDDAPDERHCFLVPGADYDYQAAPVFDVLQYSKANGICDSTGITGNSSGPLSRVAGALPVDSVMCAYNLDPIFRGTVERVEPVARPAGQYLMAAGVFQSGRYREPLALPDAMARFDRLVSAFSDFDALKREAGIPTIELLTRWSLSVTAVDKWVFGASKPEQVEQIVNFLRKGPLPSDIVDALDRLSLPGFDYSDLWMREYE